MSGDFDGVRIGDPVTAGQLNALAARAERIARLVPGCCHTTYIGQQGYASEPPKGVYTAARAFLAFCPSVVLDEASHVVIVPAMQIDNGIDAAAYPRTAADQQIRFRIASGKSPDAVTTRDFVNATSADIQPNPFPLQVVSADFDMGTTPSQYQPVGAWIGMDRTGTWQYTGDLCHFLAMVVPMSLSAEG